MDQEAQNASLNAYMATLDAMVHPLAVTGRDLTSAPGETVRASCLMLNEGVLFKPDGLSLCCWTPTCIGYDTPVKTAIALLARLKQRILDRIAAGETPYCATCPYLEKKDWPASEAITFFSFGQTTDCNLNCVYCHARGAGASKNADAVLALVQTLCADGEARPKAFDWGGNGEPTLDRHFEAILAALFALGATGTVYTNSVKYSPVIQEGLAKGALSIITSVDAGTRETYRKVRRVDGLDKFWTNIHRYLQTDHPDMVNVKYIVTEENCSPDDLDGFVRQCVANGVKTVLLSRDMHAPHLAEEIPRALAWLAGQLRGHGLTVTFLDSVIGQKAMDTIHQLLDTPA